MCARWPARRPRRWRRVGAGRLTGAQETWLSPLWLAGFDVRLHLPRQHQHRAAPAEHGVEHPARGALAVAHAPPGLILLDHLDRQPGLLEHPGDLVVGAGPLADVDLVGLQADEARQRQPLPAASLPAVPPARRLAARDAPVVSKVAAVPATASGRAGPRHRQPPVQSLVGSAAGRAKPRPRSSHRRPPASLGICGQALLGKGGTRHGPAIAARTTSVPVLTPRGVQRRSSTRLARSR